MLKECVDSTVLYFLKKILASNSYKVIRIQKRIDQTVFWGKVEREILRIFFISDN